MSPHEPHRDGVPSSRWLTAALVGAGLLTVAGGGAFYLASQTVKRAAVDDVVAVTVGARTCDPMDLTVPAGRTVFEITNASDRPIEWEILDGVMVLEERENIAPGFKSQLGGTLKPGVYAITCGLLSNPRGTLTVTASAHSDAETARPPLKAFIGPLSEYRVYLGLRAGQLVGKTAALAAAITAGDLPLARAAYAEARLPYRQIEAVGGRIADVENAIDPIATYLAGHEQDPAFTGFHRIEYGLWRAGATDGLKPVADQLAADAVTLRDRLKALKLAPADLADNAAREARRLAEGPVLSGDSLYALDDLGEFAAAVDGLDKPVSLLAPLLAAAAPETADAVTAALAATRAAITGVSGAGSPAAYTAVTGDQRKVLSASFSALADAIATINPALGLE